MSIHRQTANALGLALESRPLPHERMDVFNVAIEFVELVAATRVPRGNAAAMDQLRRAAQSVALNVAEACGKEGKDRQRFFAIARGSSLECAAALRILLAFRAIDQAHHTKGRRLFERAYAMLTRLCRK